MCAFILCEAINTISLFGIRIDEPIVVLTDLLVSFCCFYFSYKIKGKGHKVLKYIKRYFLLMGLATLIGGLIGHAFLYALSFYWKLPGWILSMFSIMLIERAVINHTRMVFKPKVIQVLRWLNVLELGLFMFMSIYTLDFFYVEFHSGYGLMFVVLGLESYLYFKTKNEASKYMLFGVGFAALAALFFMNEWSLHQWFNSIAISHVMMTLGAYFFYRSTLNVSLEI